VFNKKSRFSYGPFTLAIFAAILGAIFPFERGEGVDQL
jgi:hypothetical protein